MLKPAVLLLLILNCLALCWPSLATAQSKVVPLSANLELDQTGKDLRRALNAWETETPPKTDRWQTLQLRTGESQAFDQFHHLLLMRTDSVSAQIMIISQADPQTLTLEAGEQVTAGPFDVLLSNTRGQEATLLVRWNQDTPKQKRQSEEVQIAGYENPNRLEITTTQLSALGFAERYLQSRNSGAVHETAYAAAISNKQAPQPSGSPRPLTAQEIFDQYADSGEAPLPAQALVTFRVIRGSNSAFQSLSGAATYQSNGNTEGDGPVRARTGGNGGKITVGQPGDRFTYELRALEKKGSIKVESESFIRAIVGESARYNFRGPGGEASGSLYTRPVGRGVELSFRQTNADQSGLGIANTRLIFQNGQTLQVAKNTSSRTTSSSSGTPILKDVPFIGPGFGNSQSSSEEEAYALYVTVELE